jgi:hypothetical protein
MPLCAVLNTNITEFITESLLMKFIEERGSINYNVLSRV